ncbi:uncharacterized protein LOC122955782 [Acropora millepora]|uniref:uncharacterized protein LOC122955782 n=1 Tax=Acropora millepora TaxID=45264 RepID=UPI001CF4592B|nr:uncharacterized protein LOC122955782 [Acropora millepora]
MLQITSCPTLLLQKHVNKKYSKGWDIVVARDGWVTPVLEKDATGEEMVEVDTGVADGVRETEGIVFDDDVDTVEVTVEDSEEDVAVEHDGNYFSDELRVGRVFPSSVSRQREKNFF